MSERDQACRLRLGEDKISSFEQHADLRLIREVAVCAIVLCPELHGKAVIHRASKRVNLTATRGQGGCDLIGSAPGPPRIVGFCAVKRPSARPLEARLTSVG